jgi:hypothetical protein
MRTNNNNERTRVFIFMYVSKGYSLALDVRNIKLATARELPERVVFPTVFGCDDKVVKEKTALQMWRQRRGTFEDDGDFFSHSFDNDRPQSF